MDDNTAKANDVGVAQPVPAPVSAPVSAPVVEAMPFDANSHPLMASDGLVIKQDKQLIECLLQECLGLWCLEYDNRYEIGQPAKGTQYIKTTWGSTGFKPQMESISAMPKSLKNSEQSDLITKCLLMWLGCGACRPFDMYLTSPLNMQESFVHMNRQLVFGGMFCCPHEAVISTGGQPVARVLEDWNPGNWPIRCIEWCFLCRVPYDVQLIQNGAYVNRYRVNMNFCLCGPHCNFCGATPCFNDQLWDFTTYESSGAANPGNVSARLQRTYGGCFSPEAFIRWCCFRADNYIVQWDSGTTAEERAAILGATTLFDYVFFERKASAQIYLLLACCNIIAS